MAMLRYGSLFSGIGGFDLGFDRAGMTCAWQVEIDDYCQKVLAKHWPDVPKYKDVRDVGRKNLSTVDVIIGGDPCPKHSNARSNGKSNSPDLSGYFLTVVGRLRPGWVVRENVPAPTVTHFEAAMAHLGYGTITLRMDASPFTGQQRIRDFVIGSLKTPRESLSRLIKNTQNGPGPRSPKLGARQVTPALTTHRTRYDSRDCYIYESHRLRILDGDERERLAGFCQGWTTGFSEAARARMCGNAVVPQVAEFIARQIVAVEQGDTGQ